MIKSIKFPPHDASKEAAESLLQVWSVIVFPFFPLKVNLVAIAILSRGECGLSKCITRYLVAMAAADLMVVIIDPLMKWTPQIYFPRSFLNITPVCSVIYTLVFASTAVSVWLTVAFTFDRFVAICCENVKTKYCTETTASVVIGTVSALGCLESVAWFFVFDPVEIIDNIPWFCTGKASYYTSPAWVAFELFHRILTPCVPFLLILVFNGLTVKRILTASRVRRKLRGNNNGENTLDTEMENRRKSIILLFSITGSFILLWLTLVVFYIFQRVSNMYDYTVTGPLYITEQASIMLQILSTCTNTCIYAVTQSKFRDEVKKAVKYPLILIIKLIK